MLSLMVVPNYMPEEFGAWYMLNTWLQGQSGLPINLVMPESFAAVAQHQQTKPSAMVYVNPFAAKTYVREQGYLPLVRPNTTDEIVLICRADSEICRVEDLKEAFTLAVSANEDANYLALRLLEPAGVDEENIKFVQQDNYLAVALAVARGVADVGVVSARVAAHFSNITLSRVKIILNSRINEIHHVWLYQPQWREEADKLRPLLIELNQNPKGLALLSSLGIPEGFSMLEEEDLEFMIDVVDTLRK